MPVAPGPCGSSRRRPYTRLVFVPAERGLTAHARAALPATVPHGDAALNAGRAALLVHALTADPGAALPATEDRLHQEYRAPGMPATADWWRVAWGWCGGRGQWGGPERAGAVHARRRGARHAGLAPTVATL